MLFVLGKLVMCEIPPISLGECEKPLPKYLGTTICKKICNSLKLGNII
jgi:hypothetical protein